MEVANSVSGQPGCAAATNEEIDVLLTAIQNSSVVLRDAALRGLTIVKESLPTYKTDYEYALTLNKRIWIAKYDENEENRYFLRSEL